MNASNTTTNKILQSNRMKHKMKVLNAKFRHWSVVHSHGTNYYTRIALLTFISIPGRRNPVSWSSVAKGKWSNKSNRKTIFFNCLAEALCNVFETKLASTSSHLDTRTNVLEQKYFEARTFQICSKCNHVRPTEVRINLFCRSIASRNAKKFNCQAVFDVFDAHGIQCKWNDQVVFVCLSVRVCQQSTTRHTFYPWEN